MKLGGRMDSRAFLFGLFLGRAYLVGYFATIFVLLVVEQAIKTFLKHGTNDEEEEDTLPFTQGHLVDISVAFVFNHFSPAPLPYPVLLTNVLVIVPMESYFERQKMRRIWEEEIRKSYQEEGKGSYSVPSSELSWMFSGFSP